METILKDIGNNIIHIKNDTSRKQLPDMVENLIKLTFILAEAKSEVIRLKGMYEREFIMRKENNRKFLEVKALEQYNKAVENLDEKDIKKVKIDKVSNVDADDFTKLEMLSFVEESMKTKPGFNTLVTKLEEAQRKQVYLEPILKQYTERINAIKHTDKQNFTSLTKENEPR